MVAVVPFRPEVHLAKWREFITASYLNSNYILLSPAYLRWQFLDNPANQTGAYSLWLVTDNQTVLAQLGFVPFIGVAPDGSRFQGAYPINLVVRPEYRSAGLGAILLRRLLNEAEYVLNPGASESGAALSQGLGMTDLGNLKRYIVILDRTSAATLCEGRRLPDDLPLAPKQSATRCGAALLRELPSDAPARFPFPAPAYGAERNRAFLDWRYQRHPVFRYEFILTRDLKGLAVIRHEQEMSTATVITRLVDFTAPAADQQSLVDAVITRARTRGAALLDFYCSMAGYETVLRAAGFFDEADYPDRVIAARFQPMTFGKTTIRVTASGGKETGLGDWYVTKGDSDQDRPTDCRAVGRG